MLRFDRWLRAVTAPRVALDPKSKLRRLTNMLADLRNDVTYDETAVKGGRDAQSACALSSEIPSCSRDSSQNPRYAASQVHVASESLSLLCDPSEELMFFIRPTRSCEWQAVWSGAFFKEPRKHIKRKVFFFSDFFNSQYKSSEDLIFVGPVVSPWRNSWLNLGRGHLKHYFGVTPKTKNSILHYSLPAAHSDKCLRYFVVCRFYRKSGAVKHCLPRLLD